MTRLLDDRLEALLAPLIASIALSLLSDCLPGGLRELHWHPNANEWQYFIQGKGRMTLFHNKAAARTVDFTAGDVGFVPITLGHHIENAGDTNLVFLEMFKTPRSQDIALNDWLTHVPAELASEDLGICEQTFATIPKGNLAVLPA